MTRRCGPPAAKSDPSAYMSSGRSSIVGASVWMLVISLLLFWLPFVGPLLGGVVGGRKAGGFVLVAVQVGPMILGAILGGLMS